MYRERHGLQRCRNQIHMRKDDEVAGAVGPELSSFIPDHTIVKVTLKVYKL